MADNLGNPPIAIGAPMQELAYPISLSPGSDQKPLVRLHADGSAESDIEEIEQWMKAEPGGQGNSLFYAILWVALNELKRAKRCA